jgi:prepilin-type processing-associated H-X9-DG protein
MLTLHNRFPIGSLTTGSQTITLSDVLLPRTQLGLPVAGTRTCFDAKRHQGKMNIAFCDGHVEDRNVNTGDLQTVYLYAP